MAFPPTLTSLLSFQMSAVGRVPSVATQSASAMPAATVCPNATKEDEGLAPEWKIAVEFDKNPFGKQIEALPT
jgi:hypothetical protein